MRVVLLHEGYAQSVWRKLSRRHPTFVSHLSVEVISTYHPGNQALQTPDPTARQRRIERRMEATAEVAAALKTI